MVRGGRRQGRGLRDGGGARIQHLNLTFVLSCSVPIWAAQICTDKIGGADPNSPVHAAAALRQSKGN